MSDSLDTINQGSRGLPGNDKGQAQNIIDETKTNYGSNASKDVGANMSGETSASNLKRRLDGGDDAGTQVGSGESAGEVHERAAGKQP